MKRILPLILVGLMAFSSTHADGLRVAPDWQLPTVDGDVFSLSEAARKQPVVVLFWATWCPYCKALMPELQRIQDDYDGDIRVVAVHFRDDNGDAVAFMRRNGYDFKLLTNGEPVAKLNQVWGTPGVLIVDENLNLHFDLYDLPKLEFGKDLSHSEKSRKLAPYWAAAIRETIEDIVAD